MPTTLKNDISVSQQGVFKGHLFSASSVAEVHSIIHDIKKTSDQHHTLILFDVDETLVQQKETITGSHEWFSQSVAYLESKGLSFNEARHLVVPLQWHYHHHNELELTDVGWPELLEHLNEDHIGRVVLTRRTHPMAELTSVWFERLNLRFSENYFGEDSIVELEGNSVGSYKGKLFCGNNTKGNTLFHFMKMRHAVTPYKDRITVIFIDDREEYFSCVSSALSQFSQDYNVDINFYGIHFVALHAKIKNFLLCEEDKASLDDAYQKYQASLEKK